MRVHLPLLLSAAQAVAASFSSDIEEILSRPTFADATVGIEVRDLQGATIYSTNEDVALTPASNQKLVTSSAALSALGLDFTYKTRIFGTSTIRDGILDGDIWIVGSGDPSLKYSRLLDVAEELVEGGLKKITGKVYGDGTVFDTEFLGEGWGTDDESFEYSAQIAGLNCDLNTINVKVSPGATSDDAPIVQINGLGEEEEQYTSIQSSAKTVEGNGNSIVFSRTSGTNTVVLGGSIAVDASPVTIRTTVHDPIAFTAYRFALALKEAGVEVSTAPTKAGKVPKRARELACSDSESFTEILKQFMKPSQNMYGEALLKTIGRASNPRAPGSASSGAKVVSKFLKKAKVDTSGVKTVDGSGLSRGNTLTAQAICDILDYDRQLPEAERDAYFDSLPIAGVDGTLSGRFQDSPAKGHVRGKTGSLTRVSALSGYVSAEDGREYVFAILMNDYTSTSEARQAQDDIATALYLRKEE